MKHQKKQIKYIQKNLNLYKKDTSNGVVKVNPSQVMKALGMEKMAEQKAEIPGAQSMMMNNVNVFSELFDNKEMLETQYELVNGKWPENYNEIVIILDKDSEISDYTLYSLGIKDQNELEEKMEKINNGESVEKTANSTYTYDEMMNLSFKLLLNSDLYAKENGNWIDKSENEEYLKEKLENAEEIKVVGIIKQKENNNTKYNRSKCRSNTSLASRYNFSFN